MRLTGTSSTLPDSVRGTSAIWRISLGTWRGEQSSRMRRLIAPPARRRATAPSRSTTNSGIHSSSVPGPCGDVDDERVENLGDASTAR
jgi:hypothetical protein